MTPSPLTLRVRNVDDLAQQLSFHLAQATATALVRSTMLHPIRPPQNVPHATPRGDTTGSDIAGEYAKAVEALQAAEKAYRKTPSLDWEAQEKIGERIDRIKSRISTLHHALSGIPDSSRGYSGTPGLYAVTVPAVRYGGGVEGEQGEQRYGLELGLLPSALRVQVSAFLLSGSEAMPYRYRAQKCRYESRDNTPAADREMYAGMIYTLLTEPKKAPIAEGVG